MNRPPAPRGVMQRDGRIIDVTPAPRSLEVQHAQAMASARALGFALILASACWVITGLVVLACLTSPANVALATLAIVAVAGVVHAVRSQP